MPVCVGNGACPAGICDKLSRTCDKLSLCCENHYKCTFLLDSSVIPTSRIRFCRLIPPFHVDGHIIIIELIIQSADNKKAKEQWLYTAKNNDIKLMNSDYNINILQNDRKFQDLGKIMRFQSNIFSVKLMI